MNETVLQTPFYPPSRPISQLELIDIRDKTTKVFHLSLKSMTHSKCAHFYRLKEGGRKSQNIISQNNLTSDLNCSSCWKLNKTPENLRKNASDLINGYQNYFKDQNEHEKLTIDMVDIECCFYKWLYEEFN